MNTDTTTLIMRGRTILIAAIITACFTLLSTFGMAAEPGAVNLVNKENLKKEISQNITCPDYVTGNSDENNVTAVINVDSKGTINIEAISSPNAELKNEVVKQLSQMRLANKIPTGPFALVVKFRIL